MRYAFQNKIGAARALVVAIAVLLVMTAWSWVNHSYLIPQSHANTSNPVVESTAAFPPFERDETQTVNMDKVIPVIVLMYHHVGDLPVDADPLRRDLTVSTGEFEKQLAWLKANGYTSVTLEQIRMAVFDGTLLPKKPIAITFDDGYSDVFEYAVPLLIKYGFTGSFAIITNFPGATQATNVYATWDQIKHAKDDGMEMVCHTANHFDGSSPKFDEAYIRTNLKTCREDLKKLTATDSTILVYPYGYYSDAYIAQAKAVGFTMGYTTHYGMGVSAGTAMISTRVRVHGGRSGFDKLKTDLGYGMFLAK